MKKWPCKKKPKEEISLRYSIKIIKWLKKKRKKEKNTLSNLKNEVINLKNVQDINYQLQKENEKLI